MNHFDQFQQKMQDAGLSSSAIAAFQHSYSSLVTGDSGCIAESDLTPATEVPYLQEIQKTITADASLLNQTVVLKLNGGLGTSMGLDKAKSLLHVKGQDTFLDLMAKQVIHLRKAHNSKVKFMLMNSFSTSEDTMRFLSKYPELELDDIELMQNKAPKVNAETLQPATWEMNPSKEWCPPGHGDLYPSLEGSGKLDALIAAGYKYMFVSNSDNLGATLDLDLLTYFSTSNAPFLMECCERTENDKKGGHLATRIADGRLILRESAQCDKADVDSFQNITTHRYFNTNNLWIRLDALAAQLQDTGPTGGLKLPMIKNAKTVDPTDATSTQVIQLETAMGAAIECFSGAAAIVVPRDRFVPVKKSDDLLMLRSDAYVISKSHIPQLAPERQGLAPLITLDAKHFKLVSQLEAAGAIPSLVNCTRLKVTGPIVFAPGVILTGDVTIVNHDASKAVKTVMAGTYDNTTLDLTEAPGLDPLAVTTVSTTPIAGQKPGTSGLRQKTKTFQTTHYLENFIQATFNALDPAVVKNGTVVISGDGRFYNTTAIQIIVKMAVAAGVTTLWIGQHGLLSTPAMSCVIRNRHEHDATVQRPFGGFILSASHNPGGPDEDFGIKFNGANGGPAPESVTEAIYQHTTSLSSYALASDFPMVNISEVGVTTVSSDDATRTVTIDVFDPTEDHVVLLKSLFDFPALTQLMARPDFSLVYDSMHGVNGPYAQRIFVTELGGPASCCINGIPKEDFNGSHADPNLTYAVDLVKAMGVTATGQPVDATNPVTAYPTFGSAADGDADRNMILGAQFFVTPSDSVALLAAQATTCIPYFKTHGLKAVARSMPTSGALDRVATHLGLKMFEVPTGWKFFGNLMDSACVYDKEEYTPLICGEESFGTGSNHIREKDGMWATLAWLSILATKNSDASLPLVSVQDIVTDHWRTYGRNYYCRYDYEGVAKQGALDMMASLITSSIELLTARVEDTRVLAGFVLTTVDEFTYADPVDKSVSYHQGIRLLFSDGSRIIFRLSGTGVQGATVRMYVEKYEPASGQLMDKTADALGPLITLGLAFSQLETYVSRSSPTVIT